MHIYYKCMTKLFLAALWLSCHPSHRVLIASVGLGHWVPSCDCKCTSLLLSSPCCHDLIPDASRLWSPACPRHVFVVPFVRCVDEPVWSCTHRHQCRCLLIVVAGARHGHQRGAVVVVVAQWTAAFANGWGPREGAGGWGTQMDGDRVNW